MTTSLVRHVAARRPPLSQDRPAALSALVACPDARPPAYEAVAGLSASNRLDRFVTGVYDTGSPWVRRLVGPSRLARRRHPGIPAHRVRSLPSFDLALQIEGRLARHAPGARRALARARTDHFDRALAAILRRDPPRAALVFSDVGSHHTFPACRRMGVPTVLSMVHGDVREERLVLEREAERAPDFFPIYLSDGALDRRELDWLHQRRLRDIALADLVLVPSDHIAGWLTRHGLPADRVRVVPYAADTDRFQPATDRRFDASSCTFLFAGGITQRKGLKYLLEAWSRVRRPGWRLQLLGPLPADPSPIEPYREQVEFLGRVGHSEMPARLASADVFVFPSLFEGSAVVTYEALACGLPSIVTPSSGSVARDGREGLLVPPGEVEPLAQAIERLGVDPDLRGTMARAARARALDFTWPRYHEAIVRAIDGLQPDQP